MITRGSEEGEEERRRRGVNEYKSAIREQQRGEGGGARKLQ